MSVTYAKLTGMNPHAFSDAATSLAKGATKLHTAQTSYTSKVVTPLAAKYGWRGGGQPDALVVAQVDGLAVSTMRLRLLAGKVALTVLAAGMTKAQQRMTEVTREAENEGFTVSDDGTVSGNVSDNPVKSGSNAATAVDYEKRIKKVLAFATHVDNKCAGLFRKSDELPISSQNASPGLLERALDDNVDAMGDLAAAGTALIDVAERAAALQAELWKADGPTFEEAWATASSQQREEIIAAALGLGASIGLIALGSAMEVGGVALDLSTVVVGPGGVLTGVAVHVAGAEVIQVGAAGTIASGAVLGKSLSDIYQLAERKNSENLPPLPQREAAKPPTVQDTKLRNIVNGNYIRPRTKNWVGDGTLGDAIRSENRAGDATRVVFHREKAGWQVHALQKWLIEHPEASAADRAVATDELEKLIQAMSGR